MTDTKHQGVMAMVNIDGGKAKLLREQKGLTQLYVATAVQVTTDTISRWENKRYPTIKKENALRLAEALEVELDAILEDKQEESEPSSDTSEQNEQSDPYPEKGLRKNWPLLLLSFTIGALVIAVGWFFLSQPEPVKVKSTRILPSHGIAGQPFPITIEVTASETEQVTVILKEHFPENVTIQQADPQLQLSGIKNNTLKWLEKIQGKVLFTYIATISKAPLDQNIFEGSVAAGDNADTPVQTLGNNSISISNHHWADTDKDNIINDKEILTVYDQYGDLEKLGIDIDLIEEIWLGSGYRWIPETQTFQILP